MVKKVIAETEEHMQKSVEALKKDLASLRAGRATPALLDKITVDYYGTPSPLNQVANISVPEARLLVIQPWDKKMIGDIEKAIQKSDLGINPTNDGTVIRLAVPQLTEERRKELVKLAKKKAEESRVAIRNLRRDTNEQIKSLEKKSEISEDEMHNSQDQCQKLTDKYIKEVDKVFAEKEKEIMTV